MGTIAGCILAATAGWIIGYYILGPMLFRRR